MVGAAVAAVILLPSRWREVSLLATTSMLPTWASAAITVGLILRARSQRSDPYEEVEFLQGVAAELRAGNSVRSAVVGATARVPGLALGRAARMCTAGLPMADISSEFVAHLPVSGRLAAAAVEISAESGGRVAAVFSTLAGIQADEIELQREVVASTATIRASVVVLAGLPIVGFAYAMASGQFVRLIAVGTAGVAILVIGGALLLGGTGVILGLSRQASA